MASGYTEQDYVAVRRGSIRCAPFCGGKCTQAAFELATSRADALCKRLGKGWKPRVWENLGWHCSVIGMSGHMKVHINTRGGTTHAVSTVYGYTAFLSPDAEGVGGRWAESGKTPEAAIRNTVAVMQAERDELNAMHAKVVAAGWSR